MLTFIQSRLFLVKKIMETTNRKLGMIFIGVTSIVLVVTAIVEINYVFINDKFTKRWIKVMGCPECDLSNSDIKVPIWDKVDVERTLAPITHLLPFEVTVTSKLPYYSGVMPLKFEGTAGLMSGSKISLHHDFGDFKNTFVYDYNQFRGIILPLGAITTDNMTGKVLAEAKTVGVKTNINGEAIGVIVAEYHYGEKGQLVFNCQSEIVFGIKEIEKEHSGTKKRDYYFIWPRYIIRYRY